MRFLVHFRMGFKRKRAKIDGGKSKAIKLSLNSVLREQFRADFVAKVDEWCRVATVISALASLLFLYRTNKSFDDDEHQFFRGNGYDVIKNCFNFVLNGKQHRLPLRFRQIVQQAIINFQWPTKGGLGNAFNYIVSQYTTNVKNNIKIWSYSRVHTFFKLHRYQLNLLGHNITEIDAKNATKSVMFNNIEPTENVDRLLDQATMIGIPVGERLCDIVRKNWFQAIPIFMNIQRQVFEHHQHYELLNDLWRRYHRDPVHNPKPTIARPPELRNFHVIPTHDFKMKHIRIDTHMFFKFACTLGALKLAKGKRKKLINIEKSWFDKNEWYCWDQVFDMNKISKIGKAKEFDYAIVTDSVACSLCYMQPERAPADFSNEQIDDMYENGEFEFVLGMDPGVRTWNATVRKHIQSGVEVNTQYIYCLITHL